MKLLDLGNFDDVLNEPDTILAMKTCDTSLPKKMYHRANLNKGALNPVLDQLSDTLVSNFNIYFLDQYHDAASFLPEEIFSYSEAHEIASNVENIHNSKDIGVLIGDKLIDGQLEMLNNCVVNFQVGTEYNNYQNEKKEYDEKIRLEAERICRIPEDKRIAKALARVEVKKPIESAQNKKKRIREEQKVAREEKLANEKERKRLKWERDKAYIDERKIFWANQSGTTG
jgi:hypothetical protein